MKFSDFLGGRWDFSLSYVHNFFFKVNSFLLFCRHTRQVSAVAFIILSFPFTYCAVVQSTR